MSTALKPPATGYTEDEHAWLREQAAAAAEGRTDALDLPHLAEFMTDVANRDRREVKSRLILLMHHLLKAQYQPERISASWNATVAEQQRQLTDTFADSATLARYGAAIYIAVYPDAVFQAARETGLPATTFPPEPPWPLEKALRVDLFTALDH